MSVGTVLTDRFDRALLYATHVHGGQLRKATTIPYVAHLLAVAATVLEYGGSEDMAIAGPLHDAVEDQGGEPRLVDIRNRFGVRVADIVRSCSDSVVNTAAGQQKEDWRARKARYIDHLKIFDPETRLVSLSDKVHNARSILRDLRKPDIGSAVWGRFKQPKEDTLWYYRELANAFALLLPGQLADGNCDRTRKRIGDLSTRQASFAFQIQAFSLNLLKRLTEIVRLVNDNVSKWLVLAPGIVCRHLLSVFIEFHAFAGNGYEGLRTSCGTTRYLKKAFM